MVSDELKKRRVKLQQEANAAMEAICQGALGKSRAEAEASGCKFGGGHIAGFREGWAIIPFSRKPHYYRRRDLTHVYVALCGFTVDQTNILPGGQKQFAPGGFWPDRCKRCERKL